MKEELICFLSDSKNWKRAFITFENKRTLIPPTGGVYKIITDAPVKELMKIGERIDRKHYNFNKKITEANELNQNLIIQEDSQNGYVVYIGHQAKLQQRVREHFWGSKGTGCLNIFESEELRQYKWYFEYIEVSEIEGIENSKLSRVYLEQVVRFISGWPILCSQ